MMAAAVTTSATTVALLFMIPAVLLGVGAAIFVIGRVRMSAGFRLAGLMLALVGLIWLAASLLVRLFSGLG